MLKREWRRFWGMNKLIIDASNALNRSLADENEEAFFEEASYKAVKFDKRNFHAIKERQSNVKIGFIDGGNIEILKSGNFSFNFIRLFWTIYQGRKRIDAERVEFYVLVRAVNKDDRIYYETEIIAGQEWLKELNMKFYSYDASLKQGFHRADISFVVNIIRRFGELIMAYRACEKLSSGIIVLDGDLEASYPREEEFLERLYSYANKGIIISAVSKTSTLLSSSGNSFSAILNRKEGKWYYYPVAEISSGMHKAKILFARLNEKSGYVFKIEIYKEQEDKINELIGALSENAKDAIFLGYPYGLVEAHKFAKIDIKEKDFHKIQLMARLGSKWRDVERYARAVDGHSVLDRV